MTRSSVSSTGARASVTCSGRSLAIPALYISHDAVEVVRLADHVLHMRQGQIVADAAPEPTLDGLGAEDRDRLALAALRAGLTVGD